MDNANKPLWSDGKTGEDIDNYAPGEAIYNLHEDVLVCKELIARLLAENKKLKAICESEFYGNAG